MSKIIGIDLGTTNCAGAYYDPFREKSAAMALFKDEKGDSLLPSNLAVDGEQVLVGSEAKNRPGRIQFVKRNIEDRHVAYDISHVSRPDPIGISAEYLKAVKQRAEKHFGETVDRAVITVPAHFNHHQKTATRQAGELANLKVEDLFPEPAAAALTYSWQFDIDNATILVYDLGGGTFDATILSIKDKVCKIAGYGSGLAGESRLGGYDFDRSLAERCFLPYLFRLKRVELNREQEFAILAAAEKAKIQMCKETGSHFGSFLPAEILGEDFKDVPPLNVSLAEFGDLIELELNRTVAECRNTFEDCKQRKADLTLDRIIMVGGSSRIPFIKDKLKNEFGLEPILFEPDLCVAMGAAIYASRFGSSFESTKARIILRPFPHKIASRLNIDGVVKVLNEQGEELESASDYTIYLKDEGSPYNQTAVIDEKNRFTLSEVPVAAGEGSKYLLHLLSPSGEQPVGGTFAIAQGERLKPEAPRISQPFKIKTINGLIELLPAGAPLGSTASRKFYTAFAYEEIRIPAYEGFFPLGELLLKLPKNLAAGTPLEITVGFNQKNEIVLSAVSVEQDIDQKVELKLSDSAGPRLTHLQLQDFVEKRYLPMKKEVYEQLEITPEDIRARIKPEADFLTAIIDREIVSPHYFDGNRMMDCFMRLEFIRTSLAIPRPSLPNVEVMVNLLRKLLTNALARKANAHQSELIIPIRQEVDAFEQNAKEACRLKSIKKYTDAQQEFSVIYGKLQGLLPEMEYSPQLYRQLIEESEKHLKDSIRSFEQMFGSGLPRFDDVKAWKILPRAIANTVLQELFDELKSGIEKLAAVKSSERSEQSKIDDLQILLVNLYIPLHKKIIHEMDQKGLLQTLG